MTHKKKIIFLTKYSPNGASSRMRTFQYANYFQKDFEVTFAPLFTESYLSQKYKKGGILREALFSYIRRLGVLLRLSQYDLVWMEKEAFPFLPGIFESIVRFLSRKLIVDYDDAIFHNYDDHRLSLVRLLLGKKIDQVMRSADLVVAGNPYLSERARTAGAKQIEIAPTVIPSSRYQRFSGGPLHPMPVIGWIGSPMTQKFLDSVGEVFDELSQEIPFKLHLIGVSEDFWAERAYRVRIPWSEAGEVDALRAIDVGIMPLTNNKFEQGKCGFKLIQYMGCSKPLIASPVGVNSVLVRHGVNGYLCSTKEEWKEALKKLLLDESLRIKMGEAGRSDFETKFTQEAWGPKLVGFAHKVIEGSHVS